MKKEKLAISVNSNSKGRDRSSKCTNSTASRMFKIWCGSGGPPCHNFNTDSKPYATLIRRVRGGTNREQLMPRGSSVGGSVGRRSNKERQQVSTTEDNLVAKKMRSISDSWRKVKVEKTKRDED
ncbi:hypothetical protein HKD37_10G030064 [Glycine soja]